MATILPNGEVMNTTPADILKYLNPDGLRQLLRQERIRWNLKTNKDVDYIDKQRLFKYTGSVHNNGAYQKMEIRSHPDNGNYDGYAGVYVDSGIFGLPHNIDKWDEGISEESKNTIANRAILNALSTIPDKEGFGLDSDNEMVNDSHNRMAAILVDPVDGRAYHYSNDDTAYINNASRQENDRIPRRAVARICDVPTSISQLKNDIDMVADPDYHHTDNSFTNSNRYILDNIDDRTFVYPEISKDSSGDFIENYRVGLNGKPGYGESDGVKQYNDQPDIGENLEIDQIGDRYNERVSSYNYNKDFSGANHKAGFLPGIFRSIEELERVDLVDQHKLLRTHAASPGGLRDYNYYIHDGLWTPNWSNIDIINESYMGESQNPSNMEMSAEDIEPKPYNRLSQVNQMPYSTIKLYQWRYNRVDVTYRSEDIVIEIVRSGEGYKKGDRLVWPFGDDVITYVVDKVGVNGQIQDGHNEVEKGKVYDQSPSTNGVGLPFRNSSGIGHDATLSISCMANIKTYATQLKNNLYALVDVVPTVRSDNTTEWSDVNLADSQNGKVVIRSTAAGPAYSGINSGRGGPSLDNTASRSIFYEHGGNATAGTHVHLFRYIIDTQNPTYVMRDGVRVYLGKWVDQGPLGIERPCDIKALLFSNADCNNFNNYYKFNLDVMLDNLFNSPDETITRNPTAVSNMYQHRSDHDPEPNQRFTTSIYDSESGLVKEEDITDKVLYINEATGVLFMYCAKDKYDPTYGYGYRKSSWYPLAGGVVK